MLFKFCLHSFVGEKGVEVCVHAHPVLKRSQILVPENKKALIGGGIV